jgi:hypothetical protein
MNSNGSEVDFNQLKTIFEEVKNSDKSVNVILGVEGHLDDQEVVETLILGYKYTSFKNYSI